MGRDAGAEVRRPCDNPGVPYRLPVPWRTFTLDAPLPPDQVEAVVVRALRTDIIRGFSKSEHGFRFLQQVGGTLRRGWLDVSCGIERAGAESDAATSRLRVRMRGPLSAIVMLGGGAIALPTALVVGAIQKPGELDIGRLLLFGLLGPVAWFVFSREYDRGARALEKRLRSALQR